MAGIEGTVSLKRMRFHAHHGVMDQERLLGNEFEVSVSFTYDITGAASTDNVAQAIDYGQVAAVVAHEMEQPSRLLEHLAVRIGRSIRSRWPRVKRGQVSVCKLTPPIPSLSLAEGVTVTAPF